MKRIFVFSLFLAVLLSAFCACKKDYRQDLSPYDLADYVEEGLLPAPLRMLDNNTDFYGDLLSLEDGVTFSLRVAEDGSNLDEFAVFAESSESRAKALARNLKTYLEDLYEANREWYLSYIPNEVPKLRDAEVKTYGRYVAYAVMSENNRNRVFDLLRERLLQ